MKLKRLTSVKKLATEKGRDSDGQSNRLVGEMQSKHTENIVCVRVSRILFKTESQVPEVSCVPMEAISHPDYRFVVNKLPHCSVLREM